MPPAEPNGELKHYIIKYTSINISGDSLLKRDYCQNSMYFFYLIYVIINFSYIIII